MLSNSTKVLIAGVVLLASIAGGAFLWFPNEAVCYENCPPKRCSFDLDCGLGCFCYKGSGPYDKFDGRCVPK